jgi:hypothetical protein
MVYLSRWDQHTELPLSEWQQILHLAAVYRWKARPADYEHPRGQMLRELHALDLAMALEMALDDMEGDHPLYFTVVDVAEFCTQGEFRIDPD